MAVLAVETELSLSMLLSDFVLLSLNTQKTPNMTAIINGSKAA